MKRLLLFSALLTFGLFACDKSENAFPQQTNANGLDPSCYPGNIDDYVIPTFLENSNSNRNVFVEDFTGHHCQFCPLAAEIAHGLEVDNPNRVFISTMHSGPNGANPQGGLQATNVAPYTYNFINDVSSEIGLFFGNLGGNVFLGNPRGNVSRIKGTSGSISSEASQWTSKTDDIISSNDLKVNIQSVVNYFDQTNGAFIHVEVEKLANFSNELRLVVAFYEDSIVKPQKVFGLGTDYEYVHRDLLKAHVNGGMSGQSIADDDADPNGNYYFDYSWKIPPNIDADNAHLLIYVFDKETQEVYQVIKKKFI